MVCGEGHSTVERVKTARTTRAFDEGGAVLVCIWVRVWGAHFRLCTNHKCLAVVSRWVVVDGGARGYDEPRGVNVIGGASGDAVSGVVVERVWGNGATVGAR